MPADRPTRAPADLGTTPRFDDSVVYRKLRAVMMVLSMHAQTKHKGLLRQQDGDGSGSQQDGRCMRCA